ncbi:hypothetical protein [Plantibacter sp. ME-Dv--P-122b]|uniref:hypothetical protein n=1 Tax=Plantibacter sp. ME-Dv--P-122b TaxID=3040300 RepID=UPI00254D0DAC|nr:hypothetical protein [Plantibacter sp. ME-Dv--P-122b]
MNSTNRGLNRLLILLIGLVFVVIGAAALAVVTVPVVADWWRDNRAAVLDTIDGWFAWNPFAAVPGAATGQAAPVLVPIAGIVLLVLIAALLLAFVLRQGRGRSGVVHRATVEHGDIVLETDVAANALGDALDDTEAFSSVRVSAWDVNRAQALKVAVTCRRGVSPRTAVETVSAAVESLDRLLGVELPVLVEVGGGFRAAKPKRVLQ